MVEDPVVEDPVVKDPVRPGADEAWVKFCLSLCFYISNVHNPFVEVNYYVN